MVAVLHVVAEKQVQGEWGAGKEKEEETVVDGHVGVSCSIDERVERGSSVQRSVNQLVKHLNVGHHDRDSIHFAAAARHSACLRCVSAQANADEGRMPAEKLRRLYKRTRQASRRNCDDKISAKKQDVHMDAHEGLGEEGEEDVGGGGMRTASVT